MVLTDLVVLAIHASKIAVAEENIAHAIRAHKARLFSIVDTV
jgi:hypothetical protein